MKKISIKLSILAVLLTANVAFSQEQKEEKVEQLDEVVLSDTKFELKKEHSGKIIYKITQKDIEQNAGKSVIDLLDNIAGVEISGNNNAKGTNLGLYFRGGRSRQVAVLIDGVLVSDPTGIASVYNLNLIDINQIESIEILKGSSSTLYGSGAATGVINIILKKASKKPISLNYSASIGTNDTQKNRKGNFDEINQNVGLRGTLNKFNYIATYGISTSNGMSAASDVNSATSFEKDDFNSSNGLIKLGYAVNDKLSFEAFGNYNRYEYDYDTGSYADSDINNGYEKEVKHGLKANFSYNKGELIVIGSASNLKRGFDSFNSFGGTTDSYLYEGKSLSAEIVNKYTLNNEFHVIVGLNYQDFDNQTNTPFGNIDSDIAKYTTTDSYVSIVYTGKNGLNVNAGVRLNNHSEYGDHFVYHVNPSYNILSSDDAKVKVLASYSTAFIAPSTYQLFSSFGNLDLNPEENTTIEAGFDASYKKWLEVSSVFFYRDEENKVIFNFDPITFVSQYGNAEGKSNAKGVETAVRIKPIDKVTVNLSHTFTHKSEDFNYIPKNKIVANIVATPFKNSTFSVTFKNLSDRNASYYDATIFSVIDTTMKSYSLVDFSASYKLIKHLTVFGSLDNAFNENYEDVYGFSTRGRNIKLGIKLNF
ncbi:MAG: TonB-dependent receptor [Flavobacteriaceae bacterium]|nr:TonB-dependent receptor [Flavobacteriaceae bacterium]